MMSARGNIGLTFCSISFVVGSDWEHEFPTRIPVAGTLAPVTCFACCHIFWKASRNVST